MKTIGTDVSLDCCKAEGYLMVQFDARKKFTPEMEVKFIRYWPEYNFLDGEIAAEGYFSLADVWESYLMDQESINNFADMNYKDISEIDNIYEFLHFTDSVDAYNGVLSN